MYFPTFSVKKEKEAEEKERAKKEEQEKAKAEKPVEKEVYPQIFMNEKTRLKLEEVIKQLKTSATSTFHFNKEFSSEEGFTFIKREFIRIYRLIYDY